MCGFKDEINCFSDDWMRVNGFSDVKATEEEIAQFKGAAVKDLNLPDAITIPDSTTCAKALDIMGSGGFDQVPVVDATGNLVGLVTVGALLSKTSKGRAQPSDPVTAVMYIFNKKRPFVEFTLDTKLADLKKFFEKNSSALIVGRENGHLVCKKVVTKVDLLKYLMKH
jgi:cystathionine beta-synthase